MTKEERRLSEESPQTSAMHPSTVANDDNGFVKVTYRNKSWKRSITVDNQDGSANSEEPSNKRIKQRTDSNSTAKKSSSICIDVPRALSAREYSNPRPKFRERKRKSNYMPHLRLRVMGNCAALYRSQNQRTPVFLTDIQHLLMTALMNRESPIKPYRLCFLRNARNISHSLVLIVEGMSLNHYLSHESKFEETNKIFDTRLEVVMPPRKEGLIMSEIIQIPLIKIQATKLISKYGSLYAAVVMNEDPTLLVQSIFPIEKEKVSEDRKDNIVLPDTDKFPRTKLLLSALQMVDERYPIPLSGEMKNRLRNYIFTKDKYDPVTNSSLMYGVDCEMCFTTAGKELARISIVNEKMETVYESLVRPDNKIIDYVTDLSGITPEIMKNVTTDIKQVQQEVSALLPSDAILVGQSLQFDLHAMRMMHPYVIDTSVCFNLTGVRDFKSKLKRLARTFLNESIQQGTDGHDSVEDAAASLKLVQLKLANSFEFGDRVLEEKRHHVDREYLYTPDNSLNNFFPQKLTAIITAGELQKTTKEIIKKADEDTDEDTDDKLKSVNIYELDSNKKAVKKTREIALEHALTITNLRITEESTTLDAMDSTVSRLDKWINKLWETVAHNGLFLVLMGGSGDCPNGVAKIAIKKKKKEERFLRSGR